MDGFLVLARCPIDDVPLALYATLEEALACVGRLNACDDGGLAQVQATAAGVLSLDVSEVFAVTVVAFAGGRPVLAGAAAVPLPPGVTKPDAGVWEF